MRIHEAHKILNGLVQKRKFHCHIMIKILNIQNKERILKTEKGQQYKQTNKPNNTFVDLLELYQSSQYS